MSFKTDLVFLTQSNHRIDRLKKRLALSRERHFLQYTYRRRLMKMLLKETEYNEYLRRRVGFK